MNKLFLLVLLFSTLAKAQTFNKETSTGSMDSANNLLKLNRPLTVGVGDKVIVFIGGEVHGGGKRSYRGVGGQFPNKVYHSSNQMLLDKSQKPGTWAAVIGMKGIKRYNNGWWDASYGAIDATIPRPLVATIKKITNSGLYLYLDKAAACKTVNARVAVDETGDMLEYVRTNKVFDAKKFKFKKGDTLWFGDRLYWGYLPGNAKIGWDGWRAENLKILGNGMTFATPPGGIPVTVAAEEGNKSGFLVRDLDILQPGTYEGLGFNHTPGYGVPQTNEPFGNPWLSSPAFGAWIKNAVAINVTVHNPVAYGFLGGALVDSCHVYYDADGIKQYNGFAYIISGLTRNCTFYSPYLMRAAEIEASQGATLENFTSTNGLFASNSSTNARFINNRLILKEGSAETNRAMLSNPVFDINGRIKGGAAGITIDGFHIFYEGYLTKEQTLLRDFTISENVDGVCLKNITIVKPPVVSSGGYGYGNGYGAVIQSGSPGLQIINLQTNAKFGYAYGCNQGKDNALLDIRGPGTVIMNCRFQFAIVPADAKLENNQTDCPVQRHRS